MRMWIAFLTLSVATPVFAQDFGSTSGATSSINMSSPASTTSKNKLITPPSVIAPGLAAAGVETCLGSAAGGVSLMGAGFSLGSTRVDDGCTIRLLARQLFAFGLQNAAVALMCQDERVAIAMDTAGTSCPGRAFAQSREPSRVSAMPVQPVVRGEPVQPFTQQEKVWFDRVTD